MTWNIKKKLIKNADGTDILDDVVYQSMQEKSSIQEIHLMCGFSQGKIKIILTFLNAQIRSEFIKKHKFKLGPLFQEIGKGHPLLTWIYDNTYLQLYSANPKTFIVYLLSLIHIDNHVKEILEDLSANLGIGFITNTPLDDWRNLPYLEAKKFVLEEQQYQSYEYIFELLTYYWEQSLLSKDQRAIPVTVEEMYALANDISRDNPHYHHAQDLCVDLLMRMEPSVENENVLSIDSEESYLSALKLKFVHALNGTRQDLTDSLFHELCGFHMGMPIRVKGVKGVIETLLPVAEIIREKSAIPLVTKSNRFFVPNVENKNTFELKNQLGI
jgi:hypothetical protein